MRKKQSAISSKIFSSPMNSSPLTNEFNACETLESQLSKDADQLDLILELKEQLDLGNSNAKGLAYLCPQETCNGKRQTYGPGNHEKLTALNGGSIKNQIGGSMGQRKYGKGNKAPGHSLPGRIMKVCLIISFLLHAGALLGFQLAFPAVWTPNPLRTFKVELFPPSHRPS